MSIFWEPLVSEKLGHVIVVSLFQEIKHLLMELRVISTDTGCEGADEKKSCESLHFGFKRCVQLTLYVCDKECPLYIIVKSLPNFAT